MPVTIAKNYPYKMTDQEIKDEIEHLNQVLADKSYSPNAVLQFSPLIQMGVTELQDRLNQRVLEESRISTKFSQIISRVSVTVAILGTVISIFGAYSAHKSSLQSNVWAEQQLELLNNIKLETQEIAPQVTKKIDETSANSIQANTVNFEKLLHVLHSPSLPSDNVIADKDN